jgi:2-polyprenyl-3-methyl-5-hydroxy-6-metoxy-1,4-benzoquinol methylase
MTSYDLAPEIKQYYTTIRDEATRLTTTADGQLELIRTQELLRRHLPAAPARVLDVGGGTGIHAHWLSEDGYQVDLIDPLQHHVTQATNAGLNARLGDARALDAEADSYDVVLLLGPLYHLLERDERLLALTEAHRVLHPGGLLAAAAINRYASIFENTANTLLAHEPVQTAVEGILATGCLRNPKAFTTAYFHQPADLAEEAHAAGFAGPIVYGIEGPAWGLLKATEEHTGDSLIDSPMFHAAYTAARLAEPHPDLLAASSHLLAVARRT